MLCQVPDNTDVHCKPSGACFLSLLPVVDLILESLVTIAYNGMLVFLRMSSLISVAFCSKIDWKTWE